MSRIAAALLALTIAGASVMPAMAATTSHSTTAKCSQLQGKAKTSCLKKAKTHKVSHHKKAAAKHAAATPQPAQ